MICRVLNRLPSGTLAMIFSNCWLLRSAGQFYAVESGVCECTRICRSSSLQRLRLGAIRGYHDCVPARPSLPKVPSVTTRGIEANQHVSVASDLLPLRMAMVVFGKRSPLSSDKQWNSNRSRKTSMPMLYILWVRSFGCMYFNHTTVVTQTGWSSIGVESRPRVVAKPSPAAQQRWVDDPTIWYLAPPADLRQPVAVACFGNSGRTRMTITELRSQRPLLSVKHANNPRQPRLQRQ